MGIIFDSVSGPIMECCNIAQGGKPTKSDDGRRGAGLYRFDLQEARRRQGFGGEAQGRRHAGPMRGFDDTTSRRFILDHYIVRVHVCVHV